jgi:hypothetical protein
VVKGCVLVWEESELEKAYKSAKTEAGSMHLKMMGFTWKNLWRSPGI